MSPQPQYAPGDRVLVPGEVFAIVERGQLLVSFGPDSLGRKRADRFVYARDVHPVPPTPDPEPQHILGCGLADDHSGACTPDPRDTAIAAIQEMCNRIDRSGGRFDAVVSVHALRKLLDGAGLNATPGTRP